MNYLTDSKALPYGATYPLPIVNTSQGSAASTSSEVVTFITGAAGFARSVGLATKPVLNKYGTGVGSYWRSDKNLVDSPQHKRYQDNQRPKFVSVVETAGSAAAVIENSVFNMELMFETPSGAKDYVLVLKDGGGNVLYGWITGITVSGNQYTFTVVAGPSSSTQDWVGTLADFSSATLPVQYEIYRYDTSFAWTTGTVLTREIAYDEAVSETEQLRQMSNGDYAIDYVRGRILYKKATTGTSDTATYVRSSAGGTESGSATAVRASTILTNGYVAGTTIDVTGKNQLFLFLDFTLGSLTSMSIKIEFSPDGTNFFQETYESISAGVNTESAGSRLFAATGTYTLKIPLMCKSVKVSAIGTGTVTNSLLAITALTGIA